MNGGDNPRKPPTRARAAISQAVLELRSLAAMRRAGALGPTSPSRLLKTLRAVRGFGPLGAGAAIAALRYGERDAVLDDRGRLSFAELEARSNAVAHGLRDRGLCDGACVAILCRNHAGALIALFATAMAGCRVVLLNTGSAAAELREVCEREGAGAVIVDEDLRALLAELPAEVEQIACWREDGDALEQAQRGMPRTPPPAPARLGSIVFLTSGTTGTPRGAPRGHTRSLVVPGGLLERMPFRAREATVAALPLFHGTGMALTTLCISLGCTVVMRRRFDPEQCLRDLEAERASALLLVPTMLQRILALGEERIAAADLGALRIVFCTGSQLTAELAAHATELLDDVLYNLYGSTEVSYATIATPADLRAAPGTAGRAALGVRLAVLDSAGSAVAPGTTGRIFVGSAARFEGYTGGGGKEEVDGLLCSGDLGRLDDAGRLHVEGREDEMIVSGGENVFPAEVEELLLAHPLIADAAVVGVEDADFGQRLAAFVVAAPGAELGEEDVREHVRASLARHKAPRDVTLLDELPRNATGKVLKRELVGRAAA
jgi:fatty-acyl-CoA synthase